MKANATTGFDPAALRRVFDDNAADVRARITAMYVLLVGANVAAWVAALVAFHTRPALAGTALLAYTFGLRHAVDADHISAIDNVTRKLMQEGKRPVAVGFFFSLGHSTIVFALTFVIAIAAAGASRSLPWLQDAGGWIGTSVSAAFLYAIAAINLLVLIKILHAFADVRAGRPFDETTLDGFLMERGLIGRFCRPLLRMIDRSWHMYPLGVLFGLGFDTATEVGLLGIAAIEAGKGLPVLAIFIFPALFAAGMSLIDTTDGILMLGAYGWAFVKPIRKLYYNANVTLISVIVALFVATIEVLGLVVSKLGLSGPFWESVGALSKNLGLIGCLIVLAFVASWGISAMFYKARGYGEDAA